MQTNSLQNRPVVLELKNLQKSFGSKLVHRDVSLKIREGELIGLFGGSGTGKSVLIRSIIGLDVPDSGSVLFEGEDLTTLDEKGLIDVRKKIGFVFQNGALFDSLTVEENLAYPLLAHTPLSQDDIKIRIEEMLELIDMKGTNQLLPSELSGGMQKRAGLARATILGPKIILFDEPTAGLDPINTRRLIQNVLKLKSRGISGIFVTHDIPTAFDICETIAVLKDGVIHSHLTPQEMKNSQDPFIQSFIEGAHVQ